MNVIKGLNAIPTTTVPSKFSDRKHHNANDSEYQVPPTAVVEAPLPPPAPVNPPIKVTTVSAKPPVAGEGFGFQRTETKRFDRQPTMQKESGITSSKASLIIKEEPNES